MIISGGKYRRLEIYQNIARDVDDLEMDIVAALDAQQIHRTINDPNAEYALNNGEHSIDMTASPKSMRKFDPKKRWKNWGWKYSSTGKTCSIEEEPAEISSTRTSRHSSPNSSPKHKKAGDIATSAATNFSSPTSLQSPLRRRNQLNQQQHASTANNNMAKSSNGSADPTGSNRYEIRSSAGARLCQAFDSLQDDDGNYEFQTLLINDRPASIHIVPMSSTQLQ